MEVLLEGWYHEHRRQRLYFPKVERRRWMVSRTDTSNRTNNNRQTKQRKMIRRYCLTIVASLRFLSENQIANCTIYSNIWAKKDCVRARRIAWRTRVPWIYSDILRDCAMVYKILFEHRVSQLRHVYQLLQLEIKRIVSFYRLISCPLCFLR